MFNCIFNVNIEYVEMQSEYLFKSKQNKNENEKEDFANESLLWRSLTNRKDLTMSTLSNSISLLGCILHLHSLSFTSNSIVFSFSMMFYIDLWFPISH